MYEFADKFMTDMQTFVMTVGGGITALIFIGAIVCAIVAEWGKYK